MRAEHEKRAVIVQSEGVPDAAIHAAEAEKRKVAEELNQPGGYEAVQLRMAPQYIAELGKLAKESNTLVLPLNASVLASMVALATAAIKKSNRMDRRPQLIPPRQKQGEPRDESIVFLRA